MQSSNPDTVPSKRCGNCDAVVSARFARVFGNNQNEVSGCPNCQTVGELLG